MNACLTLMGIDLISIYWSNRSIDYQLTTQLVISESSFKNIILCPSLPHCLVPDFTLWGLLAAWTVLPFPQTLLSVFVFTSLDSLLVNIEKRCVPTDATTFWVTRKPSFKNRNWAPIIHEWSCNNRSAHMSVDYASTVQQPLASTSISVSSTKL